MSFDTPTMREEMMGYVLTFGLASVLLACSGFAWWQLYLFHSTPSIFYSPVGWDYRYAGAIMSMGACSVWAYFYAVAVRSRHWLTVAKKSWHFSLPAVILLMSTGVATWQVHKLGI